MNKSNMVHLRKILLAVSWGNSHCAKFMRIRVTDFFCSNEEWNTYAARLLGSLEYRDMMLVQNNSADFACEEV